MDNEDFDLENFVRLFDTAMTSDNPTVRKAFKNLMIVATLVDSDNENKNIGPLENLLREVRSLHSRVRVLETNSQNYKYGPVTTTSPYVNQPLGWPYIVSNGIAATNSNSGAGVANTGIVSGGQSVSWTMPENTYTLCQNEIDKWAHLYADLDKGSNE